MQDKLNKVRYYKKQFDDALHTFKKVIEMKRISDTEELHVVFRDSIIQRFEYTYETSWKLMKSILDFQGTPMKFPREILKEALFAEWIRNHEVWERIVDSRNLTSHNYSEELAIRESQAIIDEYFPALEYFHSKITKVVDEIEQST